MEELLEVLKEIKEDVDFENSEDLVTGRKLDSLDILEIIAALNEEFDISIPASQILPENFNSAKSIWALVQKLQEE